MLYVGICSGQAETDHNSPSADVKFESKVDALVKQYMDLDIFTGVVLVAEQGHPVYHKAFGLANRELGIRNTLNTRFDIGSMNKTFTKVAVLELIHEGKLSAGDALGKFLDGFPAEAAEKITVEDLLEHRSGYGDYHTEEYWALPAEQKTLETDVSFIRKLPLNFEPGTQQEYSNAGYVLLGRIIEKVTGKSYYDVIEERITKPLGMHDTYLREKYSVPGRAVGYFKTMRGELRNNDFLGEVPTPAGGFYSTTSDMLKFYRAFYYGDELWDETTRQLDAMYPFYRKNMTTGGAMVQAGGFEGANTVHYEILRDRISVEVFANMDEIVAENLGAGILSIIRGKQPEQPSLPAIQAVYRSFSMYGINTVRKNWETLTENYHPSDPKDLILNQIGYNLLVAGATDSAVAIFRLNTELFPQTANCWDSYGEALLNSGDRMASLNAYKKALEIDPELESAKAAVLKLEK